MPIYARRTTHGAERDQHSSASTHAQSRGHRGTSTEFSTTLHTCTTYLADESTTRMLQTVAFLADTAAMLL
jgi:hypothetical protein